MIRRLSLHVTLAGLTLVGPAAAQPAAEGCTAPDPVTAEVNAREGVRLAKDERFEEAVALFRIAGRLDPCTPRYPYLLGRALERQSRFDEAEVAYREVIDRFPTSVEYTRAQGAIAELTVARAKAAEEARQAAARQAAVEEAERRAAEEAARRAAVTPVRPPPVVTPPPVTPPVDPGAHGRRRPDQALSWTAIGAATMGVGALAAAAGLVGALAAQSVDDDLQLAARQPDRARYDALVLDRDNYTTMAWVGYGVGGALLVGGLVMLFVPEDEVSAAVVPTAGGAVFGLGGRFE